MPDQSQELLNAASDLVAEVVRTHGLVRLRVRGTSMLPGLRPQDVLVVRRCRGGVRAGDVVLVRVDSRLIAHRVAALRQSVDGPVLTLRGDAHLACDPAAAWAQVVGRVDSFERDGRTYATGATVAPCGRIVGVTANLAIAIRYQIRALAGRAMRFVVGSTSALHKSVQASPNL